jgi:hypothetical protein
MRSARVVVAVALVMATFFLFAAPASAADRTRRVVAGGSESWATLAATGVNTSHLADEDDQVNPQACGKTVTNYCDTTLVVLANPVPPDDVDGLLKRNVTVALTGTNPVPNGGDFDLKVYESDPSGNRGALAADFAQAAPPESLESYSFEVATARTAPEKFYLVEVIYFASANSSAQVTVTF